MDESHRREHMRAAMRGTALRLRASLGSSSPLGDSLTKGEMREEDVVAAFRPHIANRYDILKGVVVNASGIESDPQDVILLDSFALAPLLGAGQTRVIPVEGVVAVVQVKSLATPDAVRSGVANLASAKRLLAADTRFGQPLSGAHQPGTWSSSATFFGGLLFLSRSSSIDVLADTFAAAAFDGPPRERCDAMCIVDEATVLWGNPSSSGGELNFAFRGEEAEAPLLIRAAEDSLVFFYLSLLEHLRHWITPHFSWLDYLLGPTSSLSFPYSYWYDELNPPEWWLRSHRPEE